MSNDFVLDWEKELGFRSDPFTDKILEPASKFMVDRVVEKEKLNWFFIKGYFYGSIVGEHGVGKTMLLKWLQERLTKYNRIHCIYINAAIFREQINIQQQIINPLLSVYEKVWTKPHNKIVDFNYVEFVRKKLGKKSIAILIDNGHNLTDKNLELLQSLREDGLKIQVITTSTQSEFERSRLQELGNDDLGISLRRLTYEETKEMLLKRIQNCGGKSIPFNDETFRILYERADKNPRQLIHLCRDETIKSLLQNKNRKQEDNIKNLEVQLPTFKKKSEIKQLNSSNHSPPQVPSYSQVRENLNPNSEIKNSKFSGWKSPVRLKFDFSKKKQDPLNTIKEAATQQQPIHDKKKLFSNDKYSQDLLNRLSGGKPKKKSPGNSQDFDDFINGLVK